MKKIYIILIVILLVTNVFTLTQLNRSNSYITHLNTLLTKKDKEIKVINDELIDSHDKWSKEYDRASLLELRAEKAEEELAKYIEEELGSNAKYYVVPKYTYSPGNKKPEEELVRVDKSRMP